MMYSEDGKFIYVFSESARDEMLRTGYKLITKYAEQHSYVFENKKTRFDKDSMNNVEHVKSNILTF